MITFVEFKYLCQEQDSNKDNSSLLLKTLKKITMQDITQMIEVYSNARK